MKIKTTMELQDATFQNYKVDITASIEEYHTDEWAISYFTIDRVIDYKGKEVKMKETGYFRDALYHAVEIQIENLDLSSEIAEYEVAQAEFRADERRER